MYDMIKPAPLRKGDRVAILSPATVVKEEYIDGAAAELRRRGFEPVVMPHAKGPAYGSYASGYEERLADLTTAWLDPEIRMVLCARGGYGSAHLLPALPPQTLRENAKWLVGFSDISALHACLLSAGICSIHGPMAKHLTEQPDNAATQCLFRLIEGENMDYCFPGHGLNIAGKATGRLVGGNLAVINGLASSPFDPLARIPQEDVILFIEDISEAIYAVERMLWRIYMAGQLSRLKGLIVGRFTEYRPDRNFQSMEDMISSLLSRTGINDIPVAFDFPCGHVDDNMPLIHGSEVALEVGDNVRLFNV